jgi:ubiquinone/menaquinone biosynthesis C-methylase UbiE
MTHQASYVAQDDYVSVESIYHKKIINGLYTVIRTCDYLQAHLCFLSNFFDMYTFIFSFVLVVFYLLILSKFQVLLHEGGTLLVCLNSIRALNHPTWSLGDDIRQLVDGLKNSILAKLNSSSKFPANTVPL